MGRSQSEATKEKLRQYMLGRKRGTYAPRKDLRDIFVCVVEGGCAECISHCRDPDGYPSINLKGMRNKKRMARVIYEEKYGILEKGVVVRHVCDNRACININHLVSGSCAENSRDMVDRNRQAKGSKVGTSILKEEEVKLIKDLYSSGGMRLAELAKKFGVDKSTIWLIVSGKSWRHV